VDIRIDTLRVQATGMDPDTARRFARLVAERLGAALATSPAAAEPGGPGAAVPGVAGAGPAAPAPARLGSLRIAVQAPAAGTQESLAAHLAAEVSVALRSASAPTGSPGHAHRSGARPRPAGEAMS